MDDVHRAIRDAWHRIRPILRRDPGELRRRLARRDAKLLSSPPRAWCLAVRASDTRLCSPLPLGERVRVRGNPLTPDRLIPHQILLDSRTLQRLCAPVFITAPGQPLREVAALLGVTPHGLLDARHAGVFRTHHIPNPAGGKPTPLLYTDRPLDPCARGFASTDAIWSITARDAPMRIPADIHATLTRVPLFQPHAPHLGDDRDLHPEHPHLDPPPKRKSKKLPPPEHDFVWYKWRDDEFAGHDTRNPAARANHDRRELALAKNRETIKCRRRQHPAPSQSQGSLAFRGWRWQCPRCRRLVNMLYYPLPRLHLLSPLPQGSRAAGGGRARVRGKHGRRDTTPHTRPPTPAFACERCHNIRRLSRADPNSWNELVTYLSRGLLYGREVDPPAWFTCARKLAYMPRPNRAPSRRRPQIQRLLLDGLTFKQIARELNLVYGTILWHAQQIYKQHKVRSLREFLHKHEKLKEPARCSAPPLINAVVSAGA